jgi:hypothetical protein
MATAAAPLVTPDGTINAQSLMQFSEMTTSELTGLKTLMQEGNLSLEQRFSVSMGQQAAQIKLVLDRLDKREEAMHLLQAKTDTLTEKVNRPQLPPSENGDTAEGSTGSGGKGGVDHLHEKDRLGKGGFNHSNVDRDLPGSQNLPNDQAGPASTLTPPTNNFHRALEEKNFRRVDKFNSGEVEWQEFKFDVLVTTRALNADLAAKMEEITRAKEVKEDYYENLYRSNPGLSKGSKELFEVLCQLTGGQAKSLLRGLDNGDGLKAWRTLHTTYARDTLARTLRLYREVINPSQCTHADQIITLIGKWESRLKELERHSANLGETARLPEMVKLAALTEICTNDIRDLVYQHADTGMSYEQIREKIIGWTSNRIAASAAHMDIGNVNTQNIECQPCYPGSEENCYGINAMMGKCYNCGEQGHPARLCPHKGAGKGGSLGKGGFVPKGGGKGGGKPGGFQHNPAYGTKGKGKGYQGFCFNCGKQGHKAAECRSRKTNSVEIEEEGGTDTEEREVGGVWLMGHVGKLIETNNRFGPLSQIDEDDDDWTTVGNPNKPGKPEKKSKISLTTRNLKGATIAKPRIATYPISKKPESSRPEIVETVKLIANVDAKVDSAICQMTFHVTDANRILASVNKMTDVGNEVNFNKRRSYIQSPGGRKAYMKKRGGVYVLDVVFLNGPEAVRGEVIIDSGAADNVMPKNMLTGIETREKEKGTKFVAADGGELGNYGRKDVRFVPFEFWEEEFGSPFQGQA